MTHSLRALWLLAWAGSLCACAGELFFSGVACGEIPAGGCPMTREQVDYCQDQRCTALYRCIAHGPEARTGDWVWQRECPERSPPDDDADGDADASDDADADAEPPRDASALPADLPEGAVGGAGCVSLQLPECALAAGYGCERRCCECEDLFVCVRGGWELWGHCVDHVPRALGAAD